MAKFERGADVAATRDVIWAILLDAAAYPQWNRGVVHLAGDIATGRHLIATEIDGTRTRYTVAAMDEESRLTWRRTVVPGVVFESLVFLLGDSEDGVRVEFIQQVGGPLGRVLSRLVPDRSASLDAFLVGLKAAAEATPHGPV